MRREVDTFSYHISATSSIIMAARRHCACESERWCCVIDMDMFYAAVEIRDDPSLHGTTIPSSTLVSLPPCPDVPLAVGGDSMISTANYVARK